MAAKGMNVKNIREMNKGLILHLLNDYGDMSRKEIAKKTGLTPASVTKLCAELIGDGLIRENGKYDAIRSGRKEISITLRLQDKHVLGINGEKDRITFSVSDMAGELQASAIMDFTCDVDAVVRYAKEFLQSTGLKVDAVGVCIIGTIAKDQYRVWDIDALKAAIERELVGLPYIIRNNVKAFAEAEMLYGKLKSKQSVLFFKWGPGVGSSIIANGKVVSGNDSGVAEIGHYIVDPGGERCRCGRRGCLELEASSDGIVKTARERGIDMTLDELILSDREDVRQLFEEKAELISTALLNTATILNADTIILYGSVMQRTEILDVLKSRFAMRFERFRPDSLLISNLNEKRNYIGATAICASVLFFGDEG